MTNRSKPGHHVTLLNYRRFRGFGGPWAQKKTPTAVDAFALNENENVRAFPALIMPVPVDIRGGAARRAPARLDRKTPGKPLKNGNPGAFLDGGKFFWSVLVK